MLAGALVLSLAACTDKASESTANNPALATPVPAGMVRGTVVETMDAAGYTYVLVDTGEGYTVKDLGSRNGVLLNKRRLQEHERHELDVAARLGGLVGGQSPTLRPGVRGLAGRLAGDDGSSVGFEANSARV